MPRASKTAPKTQESGPAGEGSADDADDASAADAGSSTDRFVAEQHAMLLAERETYMRQADSLRDAAEQMAREMEPGDVQFDEESGEGGTMNVERERDLTLSAQARAAVEEIDQALARIEAGTYGICEQCHTPIPRARLKALPYASLCVACKSGGLSRR